MSSKVLFWQSAVGAPESRKQPSGSSQFGDNRKGKTMGNDKDLEGINIDATVVLVEHALLECANDSSYWKRICPKCEVGTLLVQREYGTFVLSLLDRCLLCGQKFIYRDIVSMRKMDWR